MSRRRPHPVWRCERCGFWIKRNGRKSTADGPDCLYCSRSGVEGKYKPRSAPLTPAMRAAPRP